MKKSLVVSISLERIEGPVGRLNRHFCCTGYDNEPWTRADAQLLRWSDTAPEKGYDKVDFTIFFDDGCEYSGTYDLKHSSVECPDLSMHVVEHCNFYAGRSCPDWMSIKKYHSFLDSCRDDSLGEFVDTHSFDDYYKPDLHIIIHNRVDKETGSFLFWSNPDGWTEKAGATSFSIEDVKDMELPINGILHPY